MNFEDLVDGINPRVRKTAYFVFGFALFALGAVKVAYGELDVTAPTWVDVAVAVALFVGGPFGVVAGANTPKRVRVSDDDIGDEYLESGTHAAG